MPSTFRIPVAEDDSRVDECGVVDGSVTALVASVVPELVASVVTALVSSVLSGLVASVVDGRVPVDVAADSVSNELAVLASTVD